MAKTSAPARPGLNREQEIAAKSAAARLSVVAATFLIVIKVLAGWMTGSISVWASLLDSAMDVFASTINFFAVRASSRPADEDHAYGHGKAESLAGLFQAVVIGGSGIFLIWEAIRRLRQPSGISSEWIGIATMVIAIIVSVLLVSKLRRVAQLTDSPALASDALHYSSDIYVNSGALAALLINAFTGWRQADPIISIAIAYYTLRSAFKVARESIDTLMDKKLPPEIDEIIARVVERFADQGVLGFHDLRSRRSGSQRFVDLHLEIDRYKTFDEAHDLTVEVLRGIESELPRTSVHIHSDPS